jgi:hypothetical protein
LSINLFGVRHLSPACAYNLIKYLDSVKPDIVLIEGMSDGNDLMDHITNPGSKPPFAILAYTTEEPVRTILYPFANYSPEYQAVMWAKKNGRKAEFIDLPSGTMLSIEYRNRENDGDDALKPENDSLYDDWARLGGEDDHDTYWERNFEHNFDYGKYRETVLEFGRSIRELTADSRTEYAVNLVREAYMRYRINKTLESGIKEEKVVVVSGSYHSSSLDLSVKSDLTDDDIGKLPSVETKHTLMPYSYQRLSFQSGYGAGNKAPYYYQMMWENINDGDLENLTRQYYANVAFHMREKGNFRSTADIIESVRLSGTLSRLHNGRYPTLNDLKDAAVTCLGHGSLGVIAESLALVDIGTEIGSIPEGAGSTPIQDNFNMLLKELKLEKYKNTVANMLDLDLRENRTVKNRELAFIDLKRSFFLNKLRFLNINFAKKNDIVQAKGSWAEQWVLQWTPESEIELVENSTRGDTIDQAVKNKFKKDLAVSSKIDEAATLIECVFDCGLDGVLEESISILQALTTDASEFTSIARTCHRLSAIINFGSIKKIDGTRLVPVLGQLYLKGILGLSGAAQCDVKAAPELNESISLFNGMTDSNYKDIDGALWIAKLDEIAFDDSNSPLVSGYCFSILLERNLLENGRIETEVSKRLSPGLDGVKAAGWFEGLAGRNKYALLSRAVFWQKLDEYLSGLDDDRFKNALVFLRRGFSGFDANEKRNVIDMLAGIWNTGSEELSFRMKKELTEDEKKKLNELDDFDFKDI